MNIKPLFIGLLTSISLYGCVNVTPIQQLALPPVTIIDGTVSSVDNTGFVLRDSSGDIYVKAEPINNTKLSVLPKEKIRVYGNLEGGQKRIFDGYVIKKENGEQIIINNPTPHIGLVVQSSF
jgi:hypothetical protein